MTPRPFRALLVLCLAAAALFASGSLDAVADAVPGRAGGWAGGEGGSEVESREGVAGLAPETRARTRRAIAAARADGVELRVTSGRRSAEHQQRLLDEAVEEYGSREEALRWVLPPDRSAHVSGRAIDVAPAEGKQWLEEHGAEFGLCRRYANESWHFEPLIRPGGTCPPLEASASGA